MNMKRVLLCGIIGLIWCVSEILSIKVYENVSEIHEAPFTIDTSSNSRQSVTSTSEPIKLFLPAQSQTNNYIPEQSTTTETLVKPPAENQRFQQYNKPVKQESPKNINGNVTSSNQNDRKKQVLQIPASLSPLRVSDPKPTNSSKRQTDDIIIESEKKFIPSHELGTFDNSEGFIPHVYHEPKVITFVQPPTNYPPQKPVKHDHNNFGQVYGEPRLPVSSQRDMQAFEHDLEDLKAKYPELEDLVSNYPIVEEIMKQKLSERFQRNYYTKQKPPVPPFSDGRYKGNNEQNQDFIGIFKFPENNDNKEYQNNFEKSKESSHHTDPEKVKLHFGLKMPFGDGSFFSAETPLPIPAGEFYKVPKFPNVFNSHDDKHNKSHGHKAIPSTDVHGKKNMSPWKRVLHLITAFLPVGILLSALTPNVINIANVPNKNYPVRQRSLNGKQELSINESGALIDLLDEKIRDEAKIYHEDPECDERYFCDMVRRGKEPNANPMETIFWKLAQSTPEHAAEAVGMKKIFKAVKTNKCIIFKCKDNRIKEITKKNGKDDDHKRSNEGNSSEERHSRLLRGESKTS